MNFVMKVYLWVQSLLFVGQCYSLRTFCDYCDCDIPDVWCSGVNFAEALNHTIPSIVTSNTTSLDVNTFDVKLILGNDTLNSFPALKWLAISTYHVAFANEYVFERLHELSYIYLELNQIHEIPVKALSHLKSSLQELHLVNQRFVNIPDNSFEQLGSLRELTITYIYNRNSLDISAGAFTGLANLTDLDLSFCGIQRLLDTTFTVLPNLQSLDLSYNRLVEVPTAIQTLKSLLKLDLSHNTLLDDPRNLRFLRGTSKLQALQMRFCAISDISSEAVDNLNAIQDLTVANFDGNPFNCTEDICSFASWYTSLPKPSTTTQSPYFIPFITLSPPPGKGPYQCDNNGQSLKEFYFESCLPGPDPATPTSIPDDAPSWHVVIITVTVILVTFVVAIVSFVVWKFRLLYYHHRFGNRFQQHATYGAVGDNTHEYSFDAYISHHEDDKQFVEDEMLPRLEDENDFELCVSFRNFRLGSNLLENVSSAQDVSRAIIFVINDRFMQNGQCKLELEMASTRMLEDEMDQGGQRLILILMEVLSPNLVNSTLRMLLNHVAYLEWDPTAEDRCWGQLIATLRTLVPEREADNEQEVDDGRDDDNDPDDNQHDGEQTD